MLETTPKQLRSFQSSTLLKSRTGLFCEPLEDRRMLATVDILAAGATGEETMEVRLFDQVIATFENVGGNAATGEFETYSFEIDFEGGELGDIDDLFIAFTNDFYMPGEVDRNLRVDAIVLRDVEGFEGDPPIRFETEAAGVYSTGTWKPEDGVVRGYRESEFLTNNGFFNYSAEPEGGTRILIEASGNEGGEQFDLQIDGETVETFTVTANTGFFQYRAPDDQRVDYDQVRIVFTNDLYDPANGIDRNLIVENVQVGRFTNRDFAIQPERSRTVFSTGSWRPEDGIAPGIRYSDTLHSNGYFQFGVFDEPSSGFFTQAFAFVGPDGESEDAGNYELGISRRGTTDGEVTIAYETRPGTADESDFVPASGTAVFADGESFVRINIPIINDNLSEGSESFDFAIFDPTGGAVINGSGVTTFEILDDEPPTTGTIYEETFSAEDRGWTINPFGTDTAGQGQWEIGFAEETSSGNKVYQLPLGFPGSRSLVTGRLAGTGIGSFDVDGGITSALSPEIALPEVGSTDLEITYNFAHTRSATSDDQLRIGVLVNGEVVNVLQVMGNEGSSRAGQWLEFTTDLSDFAGDTIQLLFEAEDSSNTVLEAAIGRVAVVTS